MKILVYFLDMFPGVLLSDDKFRNQSQNFLDFLENLGGSLHENTYSPAPDTPRSIASFFTSEEPLHHGCFIRELWPGHFMLNSNINLLLYLQNKGFKILTNLSNKEYVSQRFIPNSDKIKNSVFRSPSELNSFLLNGSDLDKYFVFIQDNIFHDIVDERSAHRSCIKKGLKESLFNLHNFFTFVNKDLFDAIVVLSDHGFKPYRYSKEPQYHLDEIRTKILFHLKLKEISKFTRNKTLLSLSDILPYVMSKLNNEDLFTEYSSFEPRKFVVIEDHSKLGPISNLRPSHWKIIRDSGEFITAWDGPKGIRFTDSASSKIQDITLLNQTWVNILRDNTVFFNSSLLNSNIKATKYTFYYKLKVKYYRFLNILNHIFKIT